MIFQDKSSTRPYLLLCFSKIFSNFIQVVTLVSLFQTAVSVAYATPSNQKLKKNCDEILETDVNYGLSRRELIALVKKHKALGHWMQFELDDVFLAGFVQLDPYGLTWHTPFNLYPASGSDGLENKDWTAAKITVFDNRNDFISDSFQKLIARVNLRPLSTDYPFAAVTFKDPSGQLQMVGGLLSYWPGSDTFSMYRLKVWEKNPGSVRFNLSTNSSQVDIIPSSEIQIGSAPLHFNAFGDKDILNIPLNQLVTIETLRPNPYSIETINSIGSELRYMEVIKNLLRTGLEYFQLSHAASP